MTPQSNFMVAAPVASGREPQLRALLATMNRAPGVVDPDNVLVPFGQFDRLHVARFVVLHDETLDDLQQYGTSFDNAPVWLVFLGDCDGPGETMLQEFAARASDGIARIFSHCDGFVTNDLLEWMQAHSLAPATQYINWVGRTVRQIREEAALHDALRERLQRDAVAFETLPALEVHSRLLESVRREGPALTPPSRTPPEWIAARIGNLIAVPLVLLALLPAFIVIAPFFLWELRRREKTDAVIAPRPTPEHVQSLSVLEDHDVTNQFSAFGSVKPGWFRLWTLVF
ncbi:MAG TPA: hypothetical protein VFL55_23075, partial [Acetobacteraceae bacterium]|nr:hypothetical protein [Acetobacteraceae bacterium]